MTKKLLFIFVMLSLAGGETYMLAQSKRIEPHYVTVLKRLILSRSLGIVTGLDHKQNMRLGDKAAQALVFISGEDFSGDPQDAGIYIDIIRTAFVNPKYILDPFDRVPTVTLEFLEKMKGKINSPEISTRIDECREYVRKKTKD
jgi:hypothetical protein